MKIIFFDIDGTLICGGSELMSESTKEAIRIARANGHICMINTGRTKRLVGENLTGQVEFDGLLLGCGTEIEYHGKQLMHKTFSMEESKAILTAMKKYHVDAVLEGSRKTMLPEEKKYLPRLSVIWHVRLKIGNTIAMPMHRATTINYMLMQRLRREWSE